MRTKNKRTIYESGKDVGGSHLFVHTNIGKLPVIDMPLKWNTAARCFKGLQSVQDVKDYFVKKHSKDHRIHMEVKAAIWRHLG